MSLQVLHPQLNQWVPPHLVQQQQQMAYYYAYDQQLEAHKTIQHWSNISPRDSESDESDGSSCHSSVSNQSPRSECGIFEISLPEERRVNFDRTPSPTLSEESSKKTPTCLGILDEMEELSLSEPTLPKVKIPATTMAFVQKTNMSTGLSMSAPPTPRDSSSSTNVQQQWMPPRPRSANTTPTNFGASTPTDYASAGATAPSAGNLGVFPPTTSSATATNNFVETHHRAVDGHRNAHHSHRHHRRQAASSSSSRHHHQQSTHQQPAQQRSRQHRRRHRSNNDYYGNGSSSASMMYYQDQMQQVQYPYGYAQQQQYAAQYQLQQQAAVYQHMTGSYGYPQQSYAYGTNGVPVVQANGYGNCM